MIIGLPGIYMYEDLKKGIYLLYTSLLFVVIFTYVWLNCANQKGERAQIHRELLIVFVFSLSVASVCRVKEYPLVHLGVNGGNSCLHDEALDIECLNELYDDSLLTYDQYESYIKK